MYSRRIALTFDIDFVSNPFDRTFFDELADFTPQIMDFLRAFGNVKSTWFISIDKWVEQNTGVSDFAFVEHADLIQEALRSGVKLGWHFHPYSVNTEGLLGLPKNSNDMLIDFGRYAAIARSFELKWSRIGWGAFSNEILLALIDAGFEIDSTCIPRPKYSWTPKVADWSMSRNQSFYPGLSNYQVQDLSQRKLREIPISTSVSVKEGDTIASVMRYFNLAEDHDYFKGMITNSNLSEIVTISHPYEFFTLNPAGGYDFKVNDIEQNMNFLVEQNFEFISLGEI